MYLLCGAESCVKREGEVKVVAFVFFHFEKQRRFPGFPLLITCFAPTFLSFIIPLSVRRVDKTTPRRAPPSALCAICVIFFTTQIKRHETTRNDTKRSNVICNNSITEVPLTKRRVTAARRRLRVSPCCSCGGDARVFFSFGEAPLLYRAHLFLGS